MLRKIARRFAVGGWSWDRADYWRERAARDGTSSVMWENPALNELIDHDEWQIVERTLPAHRGHVLDLGCGTGRLSARLAARFERYTGVDFDAMVAEAARRNPELADRYVTSTVDAYDYPEATFDFALSIACLALACSRDSLSEVARGLVRSLRPGGRLLLIEPFHTSPLLTRGCKMTGDEVASLFTGLGLRLDAQDGLLFFPTRFALAEPVLGRFPAVTRAVYLAGERLTRLEPKRFGDYAVLAFTRP